MSINEQIGNIPAWSRWITCRIFERRAWKIAHAYNIVGCDLLKYGNWELGDTIRQHGDRKWAKLYDLPQPEAPNNDQWQTRATSAESQLEWKHRRCEQLEKQIELLKRTSKAHRKLKQQRNLSL